MKKVFDQTVRDLKREVNKNVLKVPRVEQKVLDATSNEPWGPHGALLADIAMASRNYHEYQMIMTVLWKRINDTGKNWRHVYKGLTVLEYMVAHGSERVIEEIREHAHQISTLSDFQYIDSSGRDQGSNVRKKSQSIVSLVNDKDRVAEVRQKAATNKDKYRSPSSSGGMYRPGSGGYGDRYDDDRSEGRYGNRDDDRYGRNGDSYGREREWGYRDDERYGRNGDSNSRDGDRSEERYGRDSYKDDNNRGRSRSIDDNQYEQRSRSSDRDRERSFEDDGQYSSRSGPKADESQDGSKKLNRKFSEQNIGAPPSYEEAVSDSRSPVHERDVETPAAPAPQRAASLPAPTINPISSPPSQQPTTAPETSVSHANQQVHSFDEFDPRSSVSANTPEMDLLGSLALAIVPTGPPTTSETESFVNSGSSSTYVQPHSFSANQPFGDPFGDGPFKAVPSDTAQLQSQTSTSAADPNVDTGSNFDFGDPLTGLTYSTSGFSADHSTPLQNTDVLAGILPSSGPSPAIAPQSAFPPPQPPQPDMNAFAPEHRSSGPSPAIAPQSAFPPPQPPQPDMNAFVANQPGMVPQAQSGPAGQHGHYLSHASTVPMTSHVIPQIPSGPNAQFNGVHFAPQGPFTAPNNGNFYPHQGVASVTPHSGAQAPLGQPGQLNSGNFLPQQSSVSSVAPPVTYQPSNDVLGNLPQTESPAANTKPSKDKFEPKSTVWADTLSRGLVNLNISGPKTNPLADIGVDFAALNRKEKRMEKPVAAPVTSTVTMGKAMGSGSGMGRTGAGALRPPVNPMAGSGMGMGMGMSMGMGMGMGGGPPGPGVGPYGGMNNQPMGMNMGMGMGMNMGMGQGPPMQPPAGFPPGSNAPRGYNPMMGTGGGYVPQQPYGGYR